MGVVWFLTLQVDACAVERGRPEVYTRFVDLQFTCRFNRSGRHLFEKIQFTFCQFYDDDPDTTSGEFPARLEPSVLRLEHTLDSNQTRFNKF
jgi:hypothetical protein